jgi:hypothetical protein
MAASATAMSYTVSPNVRPASKWRIRSQPPSRCQATPSLVPISMPPSRSKARHWISRPLGKSTSERSNVNALPSKTEMYSVT